MEQTGGTIVDRTNSLMVPILWVRLLGNSGEQRHTGPALRDLETVGNV